MDKELEKKFRDLSHAIFKAGHSKPSDKLILWVCTFKPYISTAKKTKCKECGVKCYFDTESASLFTLKQRKRLKKVCILCALKNHGHEMSSTEKHILESTLV